MLAFSLEALTSFIVRAKAATYVGRGHHVASCRPGSHDLHHQEGSFEYLDSYFGGSDFIGEEAVYFDGNPVWAENYHGRILKPSCISAQEVGNIVQESLSAMYAEGRFLGGFEHTSGSGTYYDGSEGDTAAFTGREWITRDGVVVYQLVYHGGLIKD